MRFFHLSDLHIGARLYNRDLREDQEHIFDRFYRVDKARSRETGGTGLGLSIVKQLVTMHGGEISVHSELNHGSEFKVVFPQGGAL